MFEPHICPECWAFQNPDTGERLVCGKKIITLNILPIEICSKTVPRNWYCVPVKWRDKEGIVTFYAEPSLIIDTNYKDDYKASLNFEILGSPEQGLFKLLVN